MNDRHKQEEQQAWNDMVRHERWWPIEDTDGVTFLIRNIEISYLEDEGAYCVLGLRNGKQITIDSSQGRLLWSALCKVDRAIEKASGAA